MSGVHSIFTRISSVNTLDIFLVVTILGILWASYGIHQPILQAVTCFGDTPPPESASSPLAHVRVLPWHGTESAYALQHSLEYLLGYGYLGKLTHQPPGVAN